MKIKTIASGVMLAGMLVSGVAQATLLDRGGGLIYDTVLNVTWLQDANYAKTSGYDSDGLMNWSDAKGWASSLSYGGFDDWRLPTLRGPINGLSYTYPGDFEQMATGGYDRGYNQGAPGSVYAGSTASELAYLYFVNLGNLGMVDPVTGLISQTNRGFNSNGPFTNTQSYVYWIDKDFLQPGYQNSSWLLGNPDYFDMAWNFDTVNGGQAGNPKSTAFFAWAVRDGDVAIPEPGSAALLGLALAGLAASRRKRTTST